MAAYLILHTIQQGLFSTWPLLVLHLRCFGLDNIVSSQKQ